MCFWWKLVKTWGSFIVCHGFTNATLRYVGVICLVFHVLQLTPIRFTKTKLVLHEQIYDETYAIKISHWKSNFPWFSYGYRKCMFVVLKLETKVLPIVFTVECRVVINIWRHSPIFLKHVSLWCLLSDPHRTIHKLVIGVWLSKKNHLRPIYLIPWFVWREWNDMVFNNNNNKWSVQRLHHTIWGWEDFDWLWNDGLV